MAGKPRATSGESVEDLRADIRALAKVIQALDDRVKELDGDGGTVDQLRTAVAQLVDKVAALESALTAAVDRGESLDELAQRVEEVARQVASAGGQGDGGPVPVAWVDVEPDQAAAMLADLTKWISTVLVHHQVTDVFYPCWYRHPGLVQLLLDVRAAWMMAYRNPDGGKVFWALDFHERHLPHLREQLPAYLRRCTSVAHAPPEPAPETASEADMRAYATWWTGGRDPATEPAAPAVPPDWSAQYGNPHQQPGGQGQWGQPPPPVNPGWR